MSNAKGIKMKRVKLKYSVAKTSSKLCPSIFEKMCVLLADENYEAPIFLAKTSDEFSIVMPSSKLKAMYHSNLEMFEIDDDWACHMVLGPMPFDLVGIMATLSKILADASISLLAQSTYNTDYILVKTENEESAINALIAAGVDFVDQSS